ncbi:MAG TPA: hypothetical protein VFF70_10490 [Anaerolineae bacterium]|nr:hypothetical protein [Anaerolineae bacterium]
MRKLSEIIPFVSKKRIWSIGIFSGDSPFSLIDPPTMKNPVLTAREVTDVSAEFVADPFMLQVDLTWYMFFEVMNVKTQRGAIGLATSRDSWHWTYRQIVLSTDQHLSYPYVFKWQADCYLLPEKAAAGGVQLYRAIDFPTRWELIETILPIGLVDPSIVRYADRWWLFAADHPTGYNALRLFQADKLAGPWSEHPRSPIVRRDLRGARPAGRVITIADRLYRFAQDNRVSYGRQVFAFEITELSATTYQEKIVSDQPILTASGRGWNKHGMHHLDPHRIAPDQWIACVDGAHKRIAFGKKQRVA